MAKPKGSRAVNAAAALIVVVTLAAAGLVAASELAPLDFISTQLGPDAALFVEKYYYNATALELGKQIQLDWSSVESLWWSAHSKFTPFGVFLMAYLSVICNSVGMGLFFAFMEKSGLIERYKIQPNRHMTWGMFWDAFKNFMSTYLVVIVIMIAVGYPFLEWFDVRYSDPFPSLWTIVWQQVACLVLEDVFEYWGHRLIHVKALYPWIHKTHHKFLAPFAFTGAYAAPLEVVWLALATFFPAFIIRPHLFTFYVWINLRQFDTSITHCGYDLPNPLHLLPFGIYGGTRFHDYHHYAFDYNYASRFTLVDRLFGTYKMPDPNQFSQPTPKTQQKAKKQQ